MFFKHHSRKYCKRIIYQQYPKVLLFSILFGLAPQKIGERHHVKRHSTLRGSTIHHQFIMKLATPIGALRRYGIYRR
jgi:hypothetical protein